MKDELFWTFLGRLIILMKALQDAPQFIFMQTLHFFPVIFLNVHSRECRAVLAGHQIMQTALTVESAECR